jgi:transposase-like protein
MSYSAPTGYPPFLHPGAEHHHGYPVEVITDKAAVYPRVLDEVAPGTWHHTQQYANNRIESDHGRLKSRLRPMRGFKQLRCARVITAGHALALLRRPMAGWGRLC